MSNSYYLLLHGEILGEEYNHRFCIASVNRLLLKSWISHNSDLDLPDLSQSCTYPEKPSFYQIFQGLLFIWRSPVSSRFLTVLRSSGEARFLPDLSQTCIHLEEPSFYHIFTDLYSPGGAYSPPHFLQTRVHLGEPIFYQISHRLVFIWNSPFGADPKHCRWRRS